MSLRVTSGSVAISMLKSGLLHFVRNDNWELGNKIYCVVLVHSKEQKFVVISKNIFWIYF